MKFDVVIGNPPYQHETVKEDKLWPKFILTGVSLLTDTGAIAMITPCSWVWSKDAKIRKVKPSLTDNMNLKFYNNNCNSYFNVGQNIAWFVSIKNDEYATTNCVLADNTVSLVDFKKTHPMTVDQLKINSIVVKIDNLPQKIQMEQNLLPGSRVSTEKTISHQIPCIYTTRNRGYISEAIESTDVLKIGFNYSSSFYNSKADDHNMPITRDTFGELMMWVRINSEEEGLKIREYMCSKIIRFFVEHYKSGSSGFKMAVRRNKIPKVDLTRSWTDTDFYAHFGLTQEEIDYVESTVK